MAYASALDPIGDDRRRLRVGGGAEPWPPTAFEDSIPSRFASIVQRFAERPAISADGTTTSYAALDLRSAAIAAAADEAAARAGGSVAGRCVAILLDQGPDVVSSALGALRAGAHIVPLDPAYPEEPLRARLGHADAALILANGDTIDLARRVAGGRPVVDLDTITGHAPWWTDPPIDPGTIATLFYTSGSTGRPKGVLDSHRNVLHNVGRYTDSLAIGPDDRLTLVHPPTFSGIVSSLFSAILNGATILPFDLRHAGLDRLGAWLVAERATMLHCVPIVARAVFRGDARFPDLRVVRLEGDLATWADVERFERHTGPEAVLVNGLGATETGLTRQFFVAHAGATTTANEARDGGLPIGYQVPDMDVRILDEAGRAVGPGSVGEIVVASRYLALGYQRDEIRTAAIFGVDPTDRTRRTYRTGDVGRLDPDGRLHHLGRVDGLRKVNGRTVDPAEIVRVLEGQPGVAAAVAVTRADPASEDARLIAYVVPAGADPVDVVVLRRVLADRLEPAMVPSAIVPIPAIPTTASGKVDRDALPEPGRTRPSMPSAYRPPADPLEEELVARWEAVIGVGPIGIDDDFFELGGDSLGAMRMLLEVGEAFDVAAPPELLARAPTIAMLAAALRQGTKSTTSAGGVVADPGIVRLRDGDGPPLFAIHAAADRPWLFRSVARTDAWQRPFYSLGPTGDPIPLLESESIDGAATEHLARIRAVQPEGPYHLAGFCYGGLVAFEVAHRLRDAGEDVALLALLSVSPLEFPTLIAPDARRRYRRSVLRERWRWLGRAWQAADHGAALRGTIDRARRLVEDERFRRRVRRAGWDPMAGPDGPGRPDASDAPGAADAPDRRAARLAAVDAYRAQPFPGPVLVVAGRDATPRFLRDPASDLAGLSTEGVEVHVVPGDDHAMLADPLAATLADLLGSRDR